MKDKLNIYVYTFKETLTTKNNQYKSYSSKAIGFKEKFFGIMMQKCHYIIHYTLQIYMLLYYYTVEKIQIDHSLFYNNTYHQDNNSRHEETDEKGWNPMFSKVIFIDEITLEDFFLYEIFF